MHGAEMPHVIYVAGAMRSGSTLLGTKLGEQPGVVALGEVAVLLKDAARGGTCACGDPVLDCEAVSPAIKAAFGTSDPAELRSIASSFAGHWRTRRLLRNLLRHDPSPVDAQMRTFLSDVAQHVRPVVVDTSKSAAMLQFHARSGTPLLGVHLVRDPISVATSELSTRDYTYSGDHFEAPGSAAWTSALRWTLANILSDVGFRLARRPFVRVDFGDLVRDPEGTLAWIASELRWPVAPDAQAGLDHTAAGNPSRLDPDRTVDAARASRPRVRLTPGQRLAVQLLSAPGRLYLWLTRPWVRSL